MQTRFYILYVKHDGESYDYVVEASSPDRAFILFYDYLKKEFGLTKEELDENARGHLLPIIMKGEERVLSYDYTSSWRTNIIPLRSDKCVSVSEKSVFENDDTVSS